MILPGVILVLASQFDVAAARSLLVARQFEEVRRLAGTIQKGNALYAKAKYFEGLACLGEDRAEPALEALKEVVHVTKPPNGPITDDVRASLQLRQLAYLQLARIHYGAKQNRYAIYYYAKIDRNDPHWPDALFESAWASYRIGKWDDALSNLATLSALPAFRASKDYPEAVILKAIISFENCSTEDVLSALREYERVSTPALNATAWNLRQLTHDRGVVRFKRPAPMYVVYDDEYLWWPADGEAWRDELGTYQFAQTASCDQPPRGLHHY